MLKALKMKSLKKNLTKILIALALTVGLLAGTGFGAFKAIGGPVDLYSLDADELDGKYVTAEIYYIFDCYAYTESTNSSTNRSTVTEKEYIILTKDWNDFFGMALPSSMIREADKVMDDTYRYYCGEIPLSGLTRTVTVTGTIQKMGSESRDFFYEYFDYESLSEEDQARIHPVYLRANYLGWMPEGLTWIMTIGAACSFIYMLWILIAVLTGSYQKSVKAYCKASESPETTMEELEHFYQNTDPVNGVRVGKWILFESKGKDILLDTNNAVWAYMHTVNHTSNGIPTGRTFGVILRTRDRKKYEISMKNEAAAREVLNTIARDMPRTVLGYTPKLERFFNQRFQDFLRLPDDAALRAEVFGQ